VWFLYDKTGAFAGAPRTRDLEPCRPSPLTLPGALVRLLAALRAARPEAVVAHGHWAIVLVLPLAWLAGVRRRIGVHHCVHLHVPRPCRWLDAVVGRLGLATRLVAVSPAVADSYAGHAPAYRRRLVTIANGVAPLPRRPELPLPRPLVVCVGRISEVKNHRRLLPILAALPRLHAAIAGDGPLREALVTEARRLGVADRLHLLGECPRERLAALVGTADLVLQPSLTEGLSIALVEAMSLGVAVVASDVPGNRAVVAGAGILLPVADEPVWIATVGELLADDGRRAALAAAAARRAGDFSVTAMGDAYLALAREALP
jgi:glycosyltransferase involved in cell wall biosynthesis